MRQLLGQDESLVAPGQSLIWIPKHPQRPGRSGEAHDPGISPTAESPRAALAGDHRGQSLVPSVYEPRPGSPRWSKVDPSIEVRLLEENRVLQALGEGKALLSYLACRLEPCPTEDKTATGPPGREELRTLSHLLAELQRTGVGVFHFRGRGPLDHQERRAQEQAVA